MKVQKEVKIDLDENELIDILSDKLNLDKDNVTIEFIQEKYYSESKYHDPRDPIDPQYRVVGITLIENK